MYCRDREAADINLPLSDVLTVSNQNPWNLTLAAGQIPQMMSILIIQPPAVEEKRLKIIYLLF